MAYLRNKITFLGIIVLTGLLGWPALSRAQQGPYTAVAYPNALVTYYGNGFTNSNRVIITQNGQTWTVLPTTVTNQSLQYQVPTYLSAGTYTTAVSNGLAQAQAAVLQIQSPNQSSYNRVSTSVTPAVGYPTYTPTYQPTTTYCPMAGCSLSDVNIGCTPYCQTTTQRYYPTASYSTYPSTPGYIAENARALSRDQ